MARLVEDTGQYNPAPALTGNDYLQTLPDNMQPLVKQYAEGKQAMSPMMVRTPAGISLLSAISQYDPTFDATNYNARNKLRSDFTSGKSAQNLNAFNTVLGHLGELQSAYNNLDNTSFPAVNAIKNWVSNQVGGSAPNTFDLNKKAVVDELTRAWRGNGGSEGDIKSWSDVLNNAQSPEQFKEAMSKATHLLASKIDAMKEQYNTGMGSAAQASQPQWLTPTSQKILDNLEGNSQTATSSQTATYDALPKVAPKGQIVKNPDTGARMQFDGLKWKPL